jgi:hypothetical protein
MNTPLVRPFIILVTTLLAIAPLGAADATPPKAPARPKQDAKGNALRYAATGHVSNYEEARVGGYTLPDPLVLANGQPVRDARTWLELRRPEILRSYEREIYGRVPPHTPTVRAEVAATDTALDGAATRKLIVLHWGEGADAPKANLVLYLPAKAERPVPVLLQLVFFSGLPVPEGANTDAGPMIAGARGAQPGGTGETGPIADILSRGYGYATLRYTEIEGDSAASGLTLVRKISLAPGQDKPAPDEWGAITAWSWGASRVLDYFATDRAIDAKRVAIIGHSRLGKTSLWTGARDPRFALVFASCSGELGAALGRRDFGESIDDVAQNFPWWMAGNFQKYAGHWNEMPVDAHLLIALNAPRPVFITGGTQDLWADPVGEFLAEVAAGPVYRLLGKNDLGTKELPPLDSPLITGELGWNYHTGPHTITAGDWKAFLDFADRHLHPKG